MLVKRIRDQLRTYLGEITAEPVVVENHDRANALPLAYRQLFTPVRIEVLGAQCTGLIFAGDDLRQVLPHWQKPSVLDAYLGSGRRILIMGHLSKRQRSSCIKEGVPFVVPGAHLWMPFLGAVFDERSGRQTGAAAAPGPLSPSTQALLLLWRYRGTRDHDTPSTAATTLGYSAMTMSRAFDAIEAFNVPEISMERFGKQRTLISPLRGRDIWERIAGQAQSPVQRTVSIRGGKQQLLPPDAQLAGLTAIAQYSLLAHPAHETYAISKTRWDTIKTRYEIIDPREDPEATYQVLQIWSYAPTIHDPQATVADPVSVWLSLSDDERDDPRVEEAYAQWLAACR